MSDDDHLARARSLGSVEDAAALYREWAADYDRDVFERSQVIGSARIADLLADLVPDRDTRVVDLGCGTGAVGVRLAEHGFRRIVGYDLSPEMLQLAVEKRVYEGLVVVDLNDPTIPECEPDVIGASVSAGTFTHGHVGADAVPHLVRLLAPGSAIAWVVASPLWPDIRDALEHASVTILSADLEPIRRGADDLAHMVLARAR